MWTVLSLQSKDLQVRFTSLNWKLALLWLNINPWLCTKWPTTLFTSCSRVQRMKSFIISSTFIQKQECILALYLCTLRDRYLHCMFPRPETVAFTDKKTEYPPTQGSKNGQTRLFQLLKQRCKTRQNIALFIWQLFWPYNQRAQKHNCFLTPGTITVNPSRYFTHRKWLLVCLHTCIQKLPLG